MGWFFGLLGGLIVGGIAWGWSGAVVLGFIGWLAGLIAGSRKSAGPVSQPARPATVSAGARLDRLERAIEAMDARLARLEAGGAVAAPTEEPPPIEEPVAFEMPPSSAAQAPEPAPAPAPEPVPQPERVVVVQPPREVTPSKPNFIVAWFTGGNTIVRVGAVILFVGLIFLLNYAREHQLIPPEMRVAGVAIVGIILLVLGWKLRNKRTGYAVSLQGAGVAVLYLTIFSAMRLYHLVSPEAAFFLLAAVAIFSAFIAIGQDSLALAIIGAGGGFLAPILASTGGGNHVALFGYYLVLSIGLVVIAWFKAWRSLNVVGLAFTFLVGFAWGSRFYTPELFGTTEPFLVAFWLLYVAIAILFARARPEGGGRYVDGTIVFGAPIAAFGLQAGLTKGMEFGLAYSSLAAGAVYLILATILQRLPKERWHFLAECFLGLGVVFATLAIPLALDARWTSAAWALEGAMIVWAGVRQQRKLARAFGLLLQLGAALAYVSAYQRMPAGPVLVDAPFIGALLVSFAGLWTYRMLANGGERVTETERSIHPALFVWALMWWLFAGHHEIQEFVPGEPRLNAHIGFLAATALASMLIARRRGWPQARWPGFALAPVLWVVALLSFLKYPHPFAAYGYLAWPFAIGVQAYVLHALDKSDEKSETLPALHIGSVLLLAALGAWQMHWSAVQVAGPVTAWSVASVLLIPAALLLLVVSRELDTRWPIDRHERAYRVGAVLTLLVAMGVWILYANATHDGTSTPLPYLPILNAIDLGHGLIAICAAGAALAWRRTHVDPGENFRGRPAWIAIGILAFIWLNGVLLRSLHHWADVPWSAYAMWRSLIVQASISIFWSLIALTLMVVATRVGRRPLWMTGAALMGVVVVKLFLIDFGTISGIYRIVSFIGVGILMLVIGYFSPVPPRKREEAIPQEVTQ